MQKTFVVGACLLVMVASMAHGEVRVEKDYAGLWVQTTKRCQLVSNSAPVPDADIRRVVCKRKPGESVAMKIHVSRTAGTITFDNDNIIPNVLTWNADKNVYEGIGSTSESDLEAQVRSVVDMRTPRAGRGVDSARFLFKGFEIKTIHEFDVTID